MVEKLRREYSDRYEIIFGFANTGKEREETLEFIDKCDHEFDLNLIWLEAVVHLNKRRGCTHKIVSFENASRRGEPFESVIKKYGIPNKNYPHCTRELKLNPIRSYLTSIGWETGSYDSAVGIRVDEPRRVRIDASKSNIVYPLVHWFPMTKEEINDWWDDQTFELSLQNHQGNCDACWKKSNKKLVQIAQETPAIFSWWGRMEQKYAFAGAVHHGGIHTPRTFFRGGLNAAALVQIANNSVVGPLPHSDEDSGCSESCEPF